MNTPSSVLIVGGGPAGSAAAITLARAGLEVAVVDRARFPREKCCGDGLTTGGLRRLDALGLDPREVASFVDVDALYASSPSGRYVRVPLAHADGTFGAVARRIDLDAALIDLARNAGASVIEGDGVVAIEQTASGVAVTTASGAVAAGAIVLAADGARSTVRRLVRESEGASPEVAGQLAGRDAWFAYRQYARAVSPEAERNLWVRFDPALLPGYGWSFPLGEGRANIGIGVPRADRTSGKALRAAWHETVRSAFFTSLLGDGAVLEGSVRAWPIPTGVRKEDLTGWGGRVLFLGDAAATADPLTGEGISQALESGVLAAEAVIGQGPDRAASRYVADVGRALFTEQRISRGARTFVSFPLGARAAVRGTALRPWVSSIVGRWLYEEYPRTVVVRPRTWPLVRTPRPGAFVDRDGGSPGREPERRQWPFAPKVRT